VSYLQVRRHTAPDAEAAGRNALLVGLIHGLTGAASVVLVVPMLANAPLTSSLAFLLAFAAGSTAAMAALTTLLARLGNRMTPARARTARYAACAGSAALGLFWLLAR
jgi:hypothetical protein